MTQDKIIEMAVQAGMAEEIAAFNIPIIATFAKLVAAKEREACAKVCDSRLEKWQYLFGKDKMYKWMLGLPKEIRARGEA